MTLQSRRAAQALTVVVYTAIPIAPLYLFSASAVPVQTELGFGTRELGYAVAAFFAAGALVAPKAGVLIDRLAPRDTLRIGMVFSLASSIVIAVVAHNWWVAAVGIALCGVGHVITQLALNRMLVDGGPAANRAIWFGVKQAAVPLASLAAGVGTASLYPGLPWRGMYLVLGVASAVLLWRTPGPERRIVTDENNKGPSATPGLRRFAVAAGLAAAAGNALSLLIVDAFHSLGFSETTGPVVLGIGSGLAALTRVASGWIVDRRSSTGVNELRAWLIVASLGFAVIAVSGSSPGLLIAGAMLAFVAGWGGWQGILFFTATRHAHVPPATASGVVMAGTMVGSIFGPALVAAAADAHGYGTGWALGGAALVISAAIIRSPEKAALISQDRSTR